MKEENKKEGLPETHWKHVDPEGTIRRLEKKVEILERLLILKMIELEEMKEHIE